jgi:plasmid stability protein
MPDLLLRNVDPELKRRIAEQARANGRSLSDEAQALLASALAQAAPRHGLGTQIHAAFRDLDAEGLFDSLRNRTPFEPPDLS